MFAQFISKEPEIKETKKPIPEKKPTPEKKEKVQTPKAARNE